MKNADKLFKPLIKRYQHLNVHTPDTHLYSEIKHKELGIQQLRSLIPFTYLKSYKNCLSTSKILKKNF